jgi:peroxiredoxin/dienelactone hydrolase
VIPIVRVLFRSSSLFAALLAASALVAQERRPLTHDDYDQWKSLRGQTYTLDGSWVAFQIEPQWGDGVLEIKQTNGPLVHRFDCASGARFSADGRYAVFTQGKSKVEERNKKIDELRKKAKEAGKASTEERSEGEREGEGEEAPAARRPSGGAPQGGAGRGGAGGRRPAAGGSAADEDAPSRERGELMLLELATGKLEKLGRVKGSTVSDDVPFLLVHKEKAEPKPAEAKAEAKPGTGEEAAAAPEPAAEPAAGEGAPPARRPASGARRPPTDPLEAKRPEGTELVIRNLATGDQRTIADVVAYGLSRRSKLLWYHTSAKKPAADGKYGLFVQPLAGGEVVCLLDGIARVGNVQIDRAEQCVAFTCDKETFADDKPVADLYLWEGSGPAQRIAWAGGPGMPAGKRVAGGASFTRDGWMLTFDVQDAPPPEPLPILPEDKVTLDLWNWRDGQLQTVQQKRGQSERNPQWTAVYHRTQKRLLVLGDDRLRSLRPIGPDGRMLLGSDGRDYEQEVTWDGRYADYWLVDSQTGQRTKVLTKHRGNVTNSPGGRWLIWFDDGYRWQSYEVATGRQRDLTSALGVPFHDFEDDHPAPDAAYGLAGWTENDEEVLLYDQFDVWKIAPATGRAVCVTEGFGRQNRLRLRLQQLPRDPDRLWLEDELLLAATNVDTMAEGFFADSLTRQQRPQRLVMADKKFGNVTRPRQSSRLFYTVGTFAEFPDLWTAAADFTSPRRLSDCNPQQANYRWGRAELVRWIDGDGAPRRGVLVKPDDFDPTKKYPMLVYFYERMSQGLHSYVAPAPGTSPNAAYYVSNGYLWFMPDVVYEIGYPGMSCVKCVVSGVQHLIAQGFVDEKAIGAAGHSWGGYQTAFLVTRTHIFAAVESGAPVSNMLSAYGGIRYETGMSRQFQYEMTQSRIGGTPWQYPMRYLENSPIWFADKVKTPVLILHNDQDGAVPWTQGIEYFTALRRLGKECYLFNYNGEGHGLRNRANQKDWTRRMAEYFAHHLKKEPAPKWMTDGVPFHERDAEKLPYAQSYIDAHVKPPPQPPAPAREARAAETSAAETAPASDGAKADSPGAATARPARATPAAAVSTAKLQRGEPAPDFAIADETGTVRELRDYRGRHVLLWFYPRADTPGCTAQGCGLRDRFAEFMERRTIVLGVSVDDQAANAAFAQKHRFPFPLLCDVDRRLSIACGAVDDASARAARRIAVLIDPEGKIARVWTQVDPATFAAEALAALPL